METSGDPKIYWGHMSGLIWSWSVLNVFAETMVPNYANAATIPCIVQERVNGLIGIITNEFAMGRHGDPIPQEPKRFQVMIQPEKKPPKIPKVSELMVGTN